MSKVIAYARRAATICGANQLNIISMKNIDVPILGTFERWAMQDRDGRAGFIIMLALIIAAALAMLAVIVRSTAEPVIITLLAVLAMFGVFFLLAGAAGFLRFQTQSPSEDYSADLVEGTETGIQITSPDGEVLLSNPAFDRLMSNRFRGAAITIEQMLIEEPQNSEQIFRLTRAADNGEKCSELIEVRSKRRGLAKGGKNGTSKWLNVEVAPLNASLGAKGNIVWRIADVSSRVIAEKINKDKTDIIFRALNTLPTAWASLSSDGTILHANNKMNAWIDDCADNSGYEGRLELPRIFDTETAIEFEEKRLNTEPGQTFILAGHRARDGEPPVPITLIYRAPKASAGRQGEGSVLVFESRLDPHLVSDSDENDIQLSRFFHAAPFAIASINSDGNVESANHSFNRMFGRAATPGESTPFNIIDNIAKETRAEVRENLKTVLEGRTGLAPVDISFGPKGGRTGRFYMTPLSDAESSQAILYAIDTTEQKALEDQFAQSQKMQAVGQLAGGIAHDFNNVLTAIIGFSDLLLKNHRPTDPAFKDIINIKQNANRAAGLVRQLLAFSRRQTLRPEVLSLTDVISDLSILLSRLLGERIELKLSHGRDLWYVKADLNQFEQVIVNLAVNARDAMGGAGSLEIKTTNVSERDSADLAHLGIDRGEYVLCEVTDTGSGMSEEIMEKIFEPFFSTKEVGKGTGLGLSTVYGTIKQSGGYIFPESKPGKGTVFRIYLPRQIQEEPKDAGAIKAPERPQRDLTGSGCVLLVEDEGAVRDFAVRALRSRGYDVLEAGSGTEALEVIEEHDGVVDLIISDVVMPEMDGPTLLKELRRTNHDVKVIFISGYAEDAFKKNLPEDEEFTFLPKPFSLQQLASTVKETIG